MTITDAEKKIRSAWILGIICTFWTLILALVALASESGTFDVLGTTISVWFFLSAFLGALLTLGIYMKSRVAAVGMFAYYLISKIVTYANAISGTVPAVRGPALAPGVLLAIVFLYIYFDGARGAIAYHRSRSGHLSPGTLDSRDGGHTQFE